MCTITKYVVLLRFTATLSTLQRSCFNIVKGKKEEKQTIPKTIIDCD